MPGMAISVFVIVLLCVVGGLVYKVFTEPETKDAVVSSDSNTQIVTEHVALQNTPVVKVNTIMTTAQTVKGWGIAFFCIGLVLTVIAANIDITVDAGMYSTGHVVNLQLMTRCLIFLIISVAVMLGGLIMMIGGWIAGVLDPSIRTALWDSTHD